MVAGGGKYGFPHLLAMEAAREARQATASRSTARSSDEQLGIHLTGSRLDTGQACGSIALLVPAAASAPLRLFRLLDRPTAKVDLSKAREVI